uniref:G-protein coupled receptors family 1 profile domain-containing protein n=1 Tax=Ciona savignyi TaxID=51511 RepID=H2ZCJ9_CIOSA
TVYSDGEVILLSILTMLLCSLGLFGNLTVILVIWKDRVISKHRQNLYLLSLAVADASLVVLVVPFSLTNELLGHWPFGAVYCRIYLSVDILLCTASIWNICVIGLDRYISVKYPMTYRKFRTMPKIRLFIISVWLFAAGVSLLPFVSEIETINSERGCFINASSWYIVASCLLSFFVPSFIIWPVYIKIYMIVVLEPRHHPTPNQNGRNGVVDLTGRTEQHKHRVAIAVNRSADDGSNWSEGLPNPKFIKTSDQTQHPTAPLCISLNIRNRCFVAACMHGPRKAEYIYHSEFAGRKKNVKHFSILLKTGPSEGSSSQSQRSSCANAMSRRERRFVCIISIITGCFMACWMPFFLTYSIYAICRNCCLNNTLFKVFFWLGYLNSALNPVLYTAFNKDFRSAFKRLFRADSNRTS